MVYTRRNAWTVLNSVVKFKSLISQKSAAMNYEPEVDEDEYEPLLQVGNTGPGCHDQYLEPWLEYIAELDYDN